MENMKALKNLWDSRTETYYNEGDIFKVPTGKVQELEELGIAVKSTAKAEDEKVKVVDKKEKVEVIEGKEKKIIE